MKNKLKASINTAAAATLALFSVIRVLIYLLHRVFVPFSYTVYYAAITVISFYMLHLSKKYKPHQTEKSKMLARMLPLFTLIYFIVSALTTEFDETYNRFAALMMITAFIGFTCSVCIMIEYVNRKILRDVLHSLNGVMICFMLIAAFMSWFSLLFPPPVRTGKYISPDKTYIAVLCGKNDEQYARNKYVSIRKRKGDIFLLYGSARKKAANIYCSVNNISDISWSDDSTFVINGISYNAENALKYNVRSFFKDGVFPAERYLHNMSVYVPMRYPDEYYSNYFAYAQGGDGSATAIYRLSNAELDAIMSDINTTGLWTKCQYEKTPYDSENDIPRFGYEYDMLPPLYGCWYCMTDKEGNVITDYAGNMIICQFSPSEKTLWFYTSDS